MAEFKSTLHADIHTAASQLIYQLLNPPVGAAEMDEDDQVEIFESNHGEEDVSAWLNEVVGDVCAVCGTATRRRKEITRLSVITLVGMNPVKLRIQSVPAGWEVSIPASAHVTGGFCTVGGCASEAKAILALVEETFLPPPPPPVLLPIMPPPPPPPPVLLPALPPSVPRPPPRAPRRRERDARPSATRFCSTAAVRSDYKVRMRNRRVLPKKNAMQPNRTSARRSRLRRGHN